MAQAGSPSSVLETSGQGGRAQLPALTGLRFLASFLVLVGHALHVYLLFPGSSFVLLGGMALACLGMSLFFVLSGFVIHYNYAQLFRSEPPARALYSFLSNRLARLYPLFFCVLLLTLVLFTPGNLKQLWFLLPQYLTFSQNWLFAVLGDGSMWFMPICPQAWSISTEFYFYLLFPLVVWPLARLGSPKHALVAWLTALVVGVPLGWLICQTSDQTFRWAHVLSFDHPNLKATYVNWLAYFCPPVRFLEFLLGCLTSQLYLTLRDRPVGPGERRLGLAGLLLAVLGIGSLCATFALSPSAGPFFCFIRMNAMYGVPVAVVIFCCVRYPTRLTRWLDGPRIVLLGEASYSTYLLHMYCMAVLHVQGALGFSGWALVERCCRFVVAVALSLWVAIGTYRLIEVPSRRWLRGFLGRLPALAGSLWRVRLAAVGVYAVPILGLGLSWLFYRTSYLPAWYLAQAEQKQKCGQLRESLADLDHLVRLRPRFVRGLCKRAEIQLALGDPAAALADLERAERVHAIDAPAFCNRGQARLLLGQRHAAQADLTRALAIEPNLQAVARLQDQLAAIPDPN